MDNIITTERIEAYCLSLLADERSAGTISKYHRDLTAFSLWLDGRHQGDRRRLEKPPEPPGLRTVHRQLHAGGSERLLPLYGVAHQGEIPEDPAADLPGQRQGADEGGVRPPPHCRAGKWAGTASPDHGNSLRHGHPRVRAAVYHRGGGEGGTGHHHPQGQDPHDLTAHQAVPQAGEVRQKTKNRCR